MVEKAVGSWRHNLRGADWRSGVASKLGRKASSMRPQRACTPVAGAKQHGIEVLQEVVVSVPGSVSKAGFWGLKRSRCLQKLAFSA